MTTMHRTDCHPLVWYFSPNQAKNDLPGLSLADDVQFFVDHFSSRRAKNDPQ
jgi:hypothetical protein